MKNMSNQTSAINETIKDQILQLKIDKLTMDLKKLRNFILAQNRIKQVISNRVTKK